MSDFIMYDLGQNLNIWEWIYTQTVCGTTSP